MSSIVKKKVLNETVFKHHPKSFLAQTAVSATDFVSLQAKRASDFQIADVVAQQAGIGALRKKNVDAQVEDTVLERLKSVQESAYKEAYAVGLLEGLEKSFSENQEHFKEKLTRLDQVFTSLENLKENMLKQNEAVFMRLIFQIAEKISARSIKLEQEPILDLVKSLILEVQGADSITVKLNQSDYDFLEELRNKKVKAADELVHVKLISSPEIKIGGCIIETNYGAIVSTVEQRVEKAWAIIESKLPHIKKAEMND
jgi:flagellar assembly protein FliH